MGDAGRQGGEMTGLDAQLSPAMITEVEINGIRMSYSEAYRLLRRGVIVLEETSAYQCDRVNAYLHKQYGHKHYLSREQFALETGLDKARIDSVNRLVNGRSKKYRDMFPFEVCAEIVVLGVP
jgi:hypothetical protein